MKKVIYWKTTDQEKKRETMKKLGIRGSTVNGESDYNGDEERLREYINEGIIVIRIKQ